MRGWFQFGLIPMQYRRNGCTTVGAAGSDHGRETSAPVAVFTVGLLTRRTSFPRGDVMGIRMLLCIDCRQTIHNSWRGRPSKRSKLSQPSRWPRRAMQNQSVHCETKAKDNGYRRRSVPVHSHLPEFLEGDHLEQITFIRDVFEEFSVLLLRNRVIGFPAMEVQNRAITTLDGHINRPL